MNHVWLCPDPHSGYKEIIELTVRNRKAWTNDL